MTTIFGLSSLIYSCYERQYVKRSSLFATAIVKLVIWYYHTTPEALILQLPLGEKNMELASKRFGANKPSFGYSHSDTMPAHFENGEKCDGIKI